MFVQFKTLVEKQSGFPLKALRTDRGGEFTSSQFISFCKLYGIHRQLITAYTPQQNGISGRKNWVIVERARCMLKARELPKFL